MSRIGPDQTGASASFLPSDYRVRRVEKRTSVLSLVLFFIVMFGVVGAFFVTNRQWSSVKREQEQINRDYAEQTRRIEQLKTLEGQKTEMLEKAEITTALIERVPRSILLAELINRMPEKLTLSELLLAGKRVTITPVKADPKAAKPAARGKKSLAGAPPKKDEPVAAKPTAPQYEFTVEIVGLSATDQDVADYYAALNSCPLLQKVDLLFSDAVKVEDTQMRKFRMIAEIRPGADARRIEPLQVPRLTRVPGAKSGTGVTDQFDDVVSADEERK